MADYKAPVRDMSFVVNEVLKFDAPGSYPHPTLPTI